MPVKYCGPQLSPSLTQEEIDKICAKCGGGFSLSGGCSTGCPLYGKAFERGISGTEKAKTTIIKVRSY